MNHFFQRISLLSICRGGGNSIASDIWKEQKGGSYDRAFMSHRVLNKTPWWTDEGDGVFEILLSFNLLRLTKSRSTVKKIWNIVLNKINSVLKDKTVFSFICGNYKC